MKMELLLISIVMLFCTGLLTSCASTNGWGYPTDCCFYNYAKCGSCGGYKVMCGNYVHPCNRPYEAPCENGITHCCDYSYTFNCRDSRDYWAE